MDSSAVNANLTIDDFDSILTYADQSQWTTPDPSAPTFAPLKWWEGTYHKTSTAGASVSLNFTGPAIYIYGGQGPTLGTFQVNIDNNKQNVTTFSSSGTSDEPVLLYSANNLTYDRHMLTLTNTGKGASGGGNDFIFDYALATFQVAPSGASVSNKTLQETDSSISYSGEWGNNTSPNFSGGGTKFTQGEGASFQLDFEASAIYVLGDKKNDHGLYSVYLDNASTPEVFNGVSGCGGAFGMTCEKQDPCIKYFASNLGQGNHTLKLVNNAGVNKSFFDLDSIVLSVPSQFAPRNASSSTSGSGSSSGSGSGSSSPSDASLLAPLLSNTLLLAWVLLASLMTRGI